jgi:predicted HD phosphohydrolase
LFPDAVLEPIRLHVDAKRYLCLIDSGYWADLSPASQHSLELQGGIFDAAQAEAFMQQPFASEAVRLRRYDDLAKIPLTVTPPLSHFESYFSRVAV